MRRRAFLKHSGMLAAGALALPRFLACRKADRLLEHGFKGRVLIIGAGAAGLYAAFVLKRLNIGCTVLEASGRIGGRLRKLEGFADFPIDLGAEWLHGRNSILGDLAVRTGTRFYQDDSQDHFLLNGRVTADLPVNVPAAFDAPSLPDVPYLMYASQRGWLPAYTGIVEALAGDQGAAGRMLSAHWNRKEQENWSSGDTDHRFKATYFDLLNDHVAAHVLERVRLNTVVERVTHGGGGVTVRDTGGGTHTADKCIITVPVTVLRDGDIAFEPALPPSRMAAFGKLGMGPGMKVLLKFSQRFYPDNLLGGGTCAAYVDSAYGKDGQDHVLMAFVMGDQAEALRALGSEQAMVDALLSELDGMHGGRATPGFLAAHVHDWTSEPFIRGAYSYSTVGMGNARATAAGPVDGTLFFAGEAMNTNGHHQTVHGAVETGYHAVMRLLEPYRG